MADEKQGLPPVSLKDLSAALIQPLNHSIAAGTREAIKMGVTPEKVIEMFVNHLSSVVAMIEPPEARAIIIKTLVGQFGGFVAQHVKLRNTSPGGIILPHKIVEGETP